MTSLDFAQLSLDHLEMFLRPLVKSEAHDYYQKQLIAFFSSEGAVPRHVVFKNAVFYLFEGADMLKSVKVRLVDILEQGRHIFTFDGENVTRLKIEHFLDPRASQGRGQSYIDLGSSTNNNNNNNNGNNNG